MSVLIGPATLALDSALGMFSRVLGYYHESSSLLRVVHCQLKKNEWEQIQPVLSRVVHVLGAGKSG